MSMSMSMTAAIAAAQTAVSRPIGSRTSWCLYGPYYADNVAGPSTSISRDSYWRIVSARAAWVARIALALMGRADIMDMVDEIVYRDGPRSAASIVRTIIKAETK